MKRFIVEFYDGSDDRAPEWFVMDTMTSLVVKKYSFYSKDRADEVAECKNWDEEREIFAEFG